MLRAAVDVGILKNLMDALGTAHNIGAGVFTPDLKRIISASNHTPFCRLIREAKKNSCSIGNNKCENCDKDHFPHDGKTVGPYRCHAGNWDFAVPIVTKHGVIIGAIYGGQVRKHLLTLGEMRQLKKLAKDCGINETELITYAARLPVMSGNDIKSVIQLAEGIAREIADLVEKRASEHSFLLKLLNAEGLRKLLPIAANYAQAILNSNSCSIFLRRRYEGKHIFRREYTFRNKGGPSHKWDKIKKELIRWVADNNVPLKLDNIYDKEEVKHKGLAPKWNRKIHPEETERFLAVPFTGGSTSTAEGVICVVATKHRSPFEDGDETTLKSLSHIIWNALEATNTRERAERRRKAMAVLSKAAKLVNSGLHPQDILHQIVEKGLNILHADPPMSIYVLVHDNRKHEFVIIEGGGKGFAKEHIGMRFSDSEGIAGHLLKGDMSCYIADDVKQDPYYKDIINMHSALVVPIQSGEKFSGVISVGSFKKNVFTKEDAEIFAAYSEHVAIALRNAFAYEEVSARLDLQKLSLAALSGESSIKPICDAIVSTCTSRLCAKACSLFLTDRANRLILASSTDSDLEQQGKNDNIWYELGEGLTGWTANQSKDTVVRISSIEDANELNNIGTGFIHHTPKFPEHLDSSSKYKSFMGAPIYFDQELIGVIRLAQKHKSQTFLPSDEDILKGLANQAGICLKFARMVRENDLSLKGFAHDAAGTPVCNLLDDTELLCDSPDSSTPERINRMRLYATHLAMLMDTYILIGTGQPIVPVFRSEVDDVQKDLVEPILQIVMAPYADKSKKCEIRNTVPANFKVRTDKSRLYAILYNLIKNAANACNQLLCISCTDDGANLEFRVTDDGKGINVSQIPTFITPEHLGLYIVRTFTASLGGSLTFEKPLNLPYGTVAVVKIPKQE